jgi:hypothetical protein
MGKDQHIQIKWAKEMNFNSSHYLIDYSKFFLIVLLKIFFFIF